MQLCHNLKSSAIQGNKIKEDDQADEVLLTQRLTKLKETKTYVDFFDLIPVNFIHKSHTLSSLMKIGESLKCEELGNIRVNSKEIDIQGSIDFDSLAS